MSAAGIVNKCRRCGGTHNTSDVSCARPPLCVNCNGPHEADDKNCPRYAEMLAVLCLATEQLLSIEEAKKQMQGTHQPHNHAARGATIPASHPWPPNSASFLDRRDWPPPQPANHQLNELLTVTIPALQPGQEEGRQQQAAMQQHLAAIQHQQQDMNKKFDRLNSGGTHLHDVYQRRSRKDVRPLAMHRWTLSITGEQAGLNEEQNRVPHRSRAEPDARPCRKPSC